MISHDQNWNQPVCVAAKRYTDAAAAAPNQNKRFPTVSAIRLIGDFTLNLRPKITIWSTPIPIAKFMAAVNMAIWSLGFEGAGKLMVELEPETGYGTAFRSMKNEFMRSEKFGIDIIVKASTIKNPPMAKAVIKLSLIGLFPRLSNILPLTCSQLPL